MDYFLEDNFKASVPVSSNCFLCLLDNFLANDSIPYPLKYFSVVDSID